MLDSGPWTERKLRGAKRGENHDSACHQRDNSKEPHKSARAENTTQAPNHIVSRSAPATPRIRNMPENPAIQAAAPRVLIMEVQNLNWGRNDEISNAIRVRSRVACGRHILRSPD